MRKSNTISPHICDDCRFGEWHTQHWNRDLHGKPITLGCKRGVREFGIIRGTAACEQWESR
nr:MAG TPA: hypothetical protein [Caudoviricetes sp.]